MRLVSIDACNADAVATGTLFSVDVPSSVVAPSLENARESCAVAPDETGSVGLTPNHTVLPICLERPGSARALVDRHTFANYQLRLALAVHPVLVTPVGGNI